MIRARDEGTALADAAVAERRSAVDRFRLSGFARVKSWAPKLRRNFSWLRWTFFGLRTAALETTRVLQELD
jgi:hypothetical protein